MSGDIKSRSGKTIEPQAEDRETPLILWKKIEILVILSGNERKDLENLKSSEKL